MKSPGICTGNWSGAFFFESCSSLGQSGTGVTLVQSQVGSITALTWSGWTDPIRLDRPDLRGVPGRAPGCELRRRARRLRVAGGTSLGVVSVPCPPCLRGLASAVPRSSALPSTLSASPPLRLLEDEGRDRKCVRCLH